MPSRVWEDEEGSENTKLVPSIVVPGAEVQLEAPGARLGRHFPGIVPSIIGSTPTPGVWT